MRELSAVAEQLRSVRLAEQKFLRLWAMEQSVILPALDRVADDLREYDGFSGPINPFVLNDRPRGDDDQPAGGAAR